MPSVHCPVCGATIPRAAGAPGLACSFCGFQRRPAIEADATASPFWLQRSLADLPQLLRIRPVSEIFVDGVPPQNPARNLKRLDAGYPVKLTPLADSDENIDAIWADMCLPFVADLSVFLNRKFRQLAPGGLLYLSLPVERPLRAAVPLPGQINFFRPKNIMFLLEQRGFKMAWRKNRFSSTLRIIARRD